MKLWHVIQWGNVKDGGNGPDTNILISASSMEAAIDEARKQFAFHYAFDKKQWKTEADAVHLLGQDDKPDGQPIVVIHIWVQNAFNVARNSMWHRDFETDKWIKFEFELNE